MTKLLELTVDAMSSRIGCDVRINGFSILASNSYRPKTLGARVDGFLVPGDNRMHVEVYPVPIDPTDEERPSFQMRVLATPRGEPKNDIDTFVIAAFADDAMRMKPTGRTEVLDHRFTLAETRIRPKFLDARPMDSERGARDVSRALIGALEAREPQRVRELMTHRFEELAAASGLGKLDFEEGMMDLVEGAMKARDYVVETSPQGLEIEQGFGFRVLHVRGPGGGPAAVVRGGPLELCLSWSVADIDGRPTIVR
jgi:hypothetical protein